jgi:hypothetical protein
MVSRVGDAAAGSGSLFIPPLTPRPLFAESLLPRRACGINLSLTETRRKQSRAWRCEVISQSFFFLCVLCASVRNFFQTIAG